MAKHDEKLKTDLGADDLRPDWWEANTCRNDAGCVYARTRLRGSPCWNAAMLSMS
jgi:hypothetical protein